MAGLAWWKFGPVTPMIVREPIAVRLAWLHQAQFAGLYVAEAEGLYERAGFDVDLQEYVAESDSVADLLDDKVQFAVISAEQVLLAAERGLPIKAVAVIYQTNPYAFASLKDSGITSPADFRGKKLGNQGGNPQAAIVYQALLNSFGIPESEVEMVTLNFDEVNDLVEHRADTTDLYRTDQHYLFEKAGVPINLIYPERFGLRVYGDVLVTTNAMIAERDDDVRRFVEATLTGWAHAIDDQPTAVEATLPYTHDLYEDRAYQEHILSQSATLIRPADGFKVGTMQYLFWNTSLEVYREAGTIGKDIDIADFYTTEFLHP